MAVRLLPLCADIPRDRCRPVGEYGKPPLRAAVIALSCMVCGARLFYMYACLAYTCSSTALPVRVYWCSRRDPRRFVGVAKQLKMSQGRWTSGVPSSTQDWSAKMDINCKHVMEVPTLKENGGASRIIRIVCIRDRDHLVSRRSRIVQGVELPTRATVDDVHAGFRRCPQQERCTLRG